ncbi:hypothetical protein SAY86_022005 [Trapa natans]|uniref:MHD1 domain-containing protein n=1 Tax=Trapa natans TaxID=22666 RepID=A0AAN7N026_TRANT|nr:hypothetical protein SAY86_022005 [Trapa natans]
MEPSLLHLYRRDRRKLLEFLISLSAPSSSEVDGAVSLSDVDLDTISADYVISRIQSGGAIDIAEASEQYRRESAFPITIHLQLKDSFYLITDPDMSGSPPRRVPPQRDMKHHMNHAPTSPSSFKARGAHDVAYRVAPVKPVHGEIPSLGLPCLITGLSDDDLQGSAYEILLASMIFNGMDLLIQEKKKEKGSRLLSSVKSRKNKIQSPTRPLERHFELINTLRTQMQISEAMDSCIKRTLTQLSESRTIRQIDVPQISLGLLYGIHESDFSGEKYYVQWKNRQLNILEEIINSSADLTESEHHIVKTSLARSRDLKDCPGKMFLSEQAEVLSSLRDVAMKLSTLPGKFGLENETHYWTAGYHLNIRLYEKLLLGIFDILDEGHLIEEADEILGLIRITWSTLGINEKLHEALYSWLCFQQFLETQETSLLEYLISKLERVFSLEGGDQMEDSYVNALKCSRRCNGIEISLGLVQAIFHSISIWCDTKLQDYHLHFCKDPSTFGMVMTLVSITGVPVVDDSGVIKLIQLNTMDDNAMGKLKTYVEKSTEAAYCQVASALDLESKLDRMHPLAILADELHLVAKREFSIFYPVLHGWCPEAAIISSRKMKSFYGEQLGPYLNNLSHLSEDVKSVLSAANRFDHGLTHLYVSACEKEGVLVQELDHYKIEEFSGPIILDWIIAQHTRILQWTERASDIEEWEALSSHQRQASSAVEVFRIIEETVDHFFAWNLPMNITHLQALLSVIFHSLDAYLLKVSEQLVDRRHLLPSAPPLTRFAEMNIPIIRRKLTELTLTDNTVKDKIAASTISKLCVRLNTLQYIKKQIAILENGLKKSWAELSSAENDKLRKEEPLESSGADILTYDETIDELFITTFTGIKDSSTDAMEKICDLIGTRMVFWDFRNTLLLWLYRDSVEDARLDRFLPQFDTVLDHICGVLDDSLRDLVALSICRASLEGYVWVLLDGGPSRAFSDSDVSLMEDDLNNLKEFFIAEGEGLPRSVVDQESKVAEHILHLYSFQTDNLIQMLLNASEHILLGLDSQTRGSIPEDAQILIRILCHKKDREASKFLKKQYQLPMASEYDDTPPEDSAGSMLDILKRSSSVNWTMKGQKSIYSFKKKIQEATSEIRHGVW